ncbi:hypothetical protein [Micromonospora sp. NPDC050495]|uniref:hypothetical protein n=1 Tax=Micromonospora sp. NPDC050495 TaxID=3154936 RepID=UPI0033D95743
MTADVSGRAGDVVPTRGRPTGLRFDGRVTYLWWGQDVNNEDCAAARAGRLYTFASEADCWSMAAAHGWAADGGPADQRVVTTDVEPAQEWLRGRRMALNPEAGLNLWNWATDVAYSTGRPWNDRGGLRDGCYHKLLAANVPWAYGTASYHPRWTPRQLRALREVLNQAVHLLRAATRG